MANNSGNKESWPPPAVLPSLLDHPHHHPHHHPLNSKPACSAPRLLTFIALLTAGQPVTVGRHPVLGLDRHAAPCNSTLLRPLTRTNCCVLLRSKRAVSAFGRLYNFHLPRLLCSILPSNTLPIQPHSPNLLLQPSPTPQTVRTRSSQTRSPSFIGHRPRHQPSTSRTTLKAAPSRLHCLPTTLNTHHLHDHHGSQSPRHPTFPSRTSRPPTRLPSPPTWPTHNQCGTLACLPPNTTLRKMSHLHSHLIMFRYRTPANYPCQGIRMIPEPTCSFLPRIVTQYFLRKKNKPPRHLQPRPLHNHLTTIPATLTSAAWRPSRAPKSYDTVPLPLRPPNLFLILHHHSLPQITTHLSSPFRELPPTRPQCLPSR